MVGEGSCEAVTVRPMTTHDARWTAQLHQQALSVGLFPSLGARFLARYHRSYIESPHAVALLATSGGEPAGFVLGVLRPAAHRRETLRQHGLGLAGQGLRAIVVRPHVLVRFLRTRSLAYARLLWRYLRPGRPAAPASDAPSAAAVLSHLAVDASMRGHGVGSVLVEAFVKAAAEERVPVVETWTLDRSAFYESLGWTSAGCGQTFDGAALHKLIRRTGVDPRLGPVHPAGVGRSSP